MQTIKIIDLFAGIGGIRLGFEQAYSNIKCTFTSEIDKYAIQTYLANFPKSTISGDITQIDNSCIPKHDILLAGFPCQPFSQAGLQKGFDDTRGTLFFEIKRILQSKQPAAFLLENVARLKTHNNGNTFKVILNSLNEVGYTNVYYKVLKAKDFGLPQNRARIYIIGFLDKNISFEFPNLLNVKTKLGDILEFNVPSKYTISDKLWAGHQRRKVINKAQGKGFGYGLFNKNSKYTNTLSARYYKDGSEILIEQQNNNPRKLTPREAARLQGFPDDFQIVVSDNEAYKQFGNSVAVNVITKLAKQMLISLKVY